MNKGKSSFNRYGTVTVREEKRREKKRRDIEEKRSEAKP
jgi:hypothetical protein